MLKVTRPCASAGRALRARRALAWLSRQSSPPPRQVPTVPCRDEPCRSPDLLRSLPRSAARALTPAAQWHVRNWAVRNLPARPPQRPAPRRSGVRDMIHRLRCGEFGIHCVCCPGAQAPGRGCHLRDLALQAAQCRGAFRLERCFLQRRAGSGDRGVAGSPKSSASSASTSGCVG